MRFDVITLFPDIIKNALNAGVVGKAIEKQYVFVDTFNPRNYTHDKHKTVDDRPYGGGCGMVMKYQPLHDALKAIEKKNCYKTVYLSPQGKVITQSLLRENSEFEQLILVAGRYEGIDERFITLHCDEEWSLGDYVISGGEFAALVVIDGITRLLPDVLGDENSANQDSHSNGLLDYPHFTRPECVNGLNVPDVLLSGNHAEIEKWRKQKALEKTWQKRPDLLEKKQLTVQEQQLLKEFKNKVK